MRVARGRESLNPPHNPKVPGSKLDLWTGEPGRRSWSIEHRSGRMADSRNSSSSAGGSPSRLRGGHGVKSDRLGGRAPSMVLLNGASGS